MAEDHGYLLAEDRDVLSGQYFLHQYCAEGKGETQYLNVDSEIKAYLLIVIDGKEEAKIIVGEGVQHIPLHLSYEKRLDIYVMPHESVGREVPVDNPQTGQASVWFNVI